jgi:hypothetical protein
MDWVSFLPPFFGVLAAFLIQRGWSWIEDRRGRKKLLQGIKKELKHCSDLLVGKGNLVPTDMWKSGVSSGLMKLVPYDLKMELASIYFAIDCHNHEAERVRDVSILAATTQEKPKAEIDVELQDKRKVRVESPWTHAEILHSELSVRLVKREEELKRDIDNLLGRNIWDC